MYCTPGNMKNDLLRIDLMVLLKGFWLVERKGEIN